ncbi:SRPBCC domain-containing protein [Microbacterium jejuense]|uniref:SRPBCC family protein n=1 Tax=Microbacterium jejuense TaxID=1263637 RepID=UPI0031ED3C5A
MTDHVAVAEADVHASPARVWAVLTEPEHLQEVWFGAHVSTDWIPGSQATWSGVWEGKPYQDRGEVLEVVPEQLLKFTHYSPLSGKPDTPENRHTLTFTLTRAATATHLTLTQDNNDTPEAARHSEAMWQALVVKVKELSESDDS